MADYAISNLDSEFEELEGFDKEEELPISEPPPPPPKRGPGRPRKVVPSTGGELPLDTPAANSTVPPAEKRGRGRPRKVARKVGRPRKVYDSSGDESDDDKDDPEEELPTVPKRGRGRPRKDSSTPSVIRNESADRPRAVSVDEPTWDESGRRPRVATQRFSIGNTRSLSYSAVVGATQSTTEKLKSAALSPRHAVSPRHDVVKRPRGRPPKHSSVHVVSTSSLSTAVDAFVATSTPGNGSDPTKNEGHWMRAHASVGVRVSAYRPFDNRQSVKFEPYKNWVQLDGVVKKCVPESAEGAQNHKFRVEWEDDDEADLSLDELFQGVLLYQRQHDFDSAQGASSSSTAAPLVTAPAAGEPRSPGKALKTAKEKEDFQKLLTHLEASE